MNKKRMIICGIFFLSLLLFLPTVIKAAEAQMENQVGIEFENDYTPTENSTDTSKPTGSSTPAPTGSGTQTGNVSGGKTFFPQTGETKQKSLFWIGFVLVIGTAIWYRKKRTSKHRR